jgi:hypothetical protein
MKSSSFDGAARQTREVKPRMLLFQKRFHQGLLDGTTTLTFRAWPKAKVKPGGRYRCHPIGVLEVDAIERTLVSQISEGDALNAGFSTRRDLIQFLSEKTSVEETSEIFRVKFRYVGDGDRVATAVETELDQEALTIIATKLARMDEKAETGRWTARTLAIIRERPRIAASQLAISLKREKLAFKADVVKLKRLGLTQSFEVGYALTPRGEVFLAWQDAARASRRRR